MVMRGWAARCARTPKSIAVITGTSFRPSVFGGSVSPCPPRGNGHFVLYGAA